MKMLLIDGNSMLFRAFYATNYTNMLKTSTGIPTNAVFAFANMLNKAIDMLHPEYCVVAFDKGKHTFRHDLNPDYKGGRKATPEELIPQFKIVREFLYSYGIPFLEMDNIEADDIIGSLSKKYTDVDIAILSSDRDLLQLIDKTTTVYLMKKGLSDIVMMDEKALHEEYSLKPYQIIELKALMGDNSDNIKGVQGVGEVTATKLIDQYDCIENLYNHIDEIKGKLKEKLIIDKDSAFLSKQLATIKTDVDIPNALAEFILNLNYEEVNKFYDKYEMLSLKQKINSKTKADPDFKRLSKISDKATKEGTLIYLSTDEFSYYNPKIYGITFKNDEIIEYIPFEDFIKDEKALSFIASDVHKYTYNLKFMLHAFDYHNLKIGANTDDLMLMAFLSNNYLDSIETIFTHFNYDEIVESQEIYGTEKKPKLVDTIAETKRACMIADCLFEAIKNIKKVLVEDRIEKLYKELELPLTYVLYNMEKEGIHCDLNTLKNIGEEFKIIIDECAKEIYYLAHKEFNINSPKQMSEVLFDYLGLPANKKRSTNIESLLKIEDYHPVVPKIIKYRKYMKLYSTYIEGLSKYVVDGKIHTVFSQTITQTGRLSSSEPNLQNISVKDEDGRLIRKAFTASKSDNILISSDYSQIELRVLAHLANEKKMIEAFNNGIDIHTKTAMDIFKLANIEDVSPMLRRQAKAINFGVVYGISDFGLAKQASLSIKDAKKYIDEYFITYPNIKRFLDDSINFCEENGYVFTMMNRRRYIKEINDSNYMIKEFGKRAAMNSRVQGSAADLIKIAMLKIDKTIKEHNLKSKMILQIHDELIFDVYPDEKDIMIEIIKEGMKNAMKIDVNLESSLNIAYSWYDAK